MRLVSPLNQNKVLLKVAHAPKSLNHNRCYPIPAESSRQLGDGANRTGFFPAPCESSFIEESQLSDGVAYADTDACQM